MSIYKIDIKEESTNVNYNNTANKYTFDFKKCTCSDLNIKYIKLEDNDIFIYDKNHVQHYKGHLNFLESVFRSPDIILNYNLEPNINYVGGSFILNKNQGTIIFNGSSLRFFNAYRGTISKY